MARKMNKFQLALSVSVVISLTGHQQFVHADDRASARPPNPLPKGPDSQKDEFALKACLARRLHSGQHGYGMTLNRRIPDELLQTTKPLDRDIAFLKKLQERTVAALGRLETGNCEGFDGPNLKDQLVKREAVDDCLNLEIQGTPVAKPNLVTGPPVKPGSLQNLPEPEPAGRATNNAPATPQKPTCKVSKGPKNDSKPQVSSDKNTESSGSSGKKSAGNEPEVPPTPSEDPEDQKTCVGVLKELEQAQRNGELEATRRPRPKENNLPVATLGQEKRSPDQPTREEDEIKEFLERKKVRCQNDKDKLFGENPLLGFLPPGQNQQPANVTQAKLKCKEAAAKHRKDLGLIQINPRDSQSLGFLAATPFVTELLRSDPEGSDGPVCESYLRLLRMLENKARSTKNFNAAVGIGAGVACLLVTPLVCGGVALAAGGVAALNSRLKGSEYDRQADVLAGLKHLGPEARVSPLQEREKRIAAEEERRDALIEAGLSVVPFVPGTLKKAALLKPGEFNKQVIAPIVRDRTIKEAQRARPDLDMPGYLEYAKKIWDSPLMTDQHKAILTADAYYIMRLNAMDPARAAVGRRALGDVVEDANRTLAFKTYGPHYDPLNAQINLGDIRLWSESPIVKELVRVHEFKHLDIMGKPDLETIKKLSKLTVAQLAGFKKVNPYVGQLQEYQAVAAQFDFLQAIPANVRRQIVNQLKRPPQGSEDHFTATLRPIMVKAVERSFSLNRNEYMRLQTLTHNYNGTRDFNRDSFKDAALARVALSGLFLALLSGSENR